jgi:hypothetical protein
MSRRRVDVRADCQFEQDDGRRVGDMSGERGSWNSVEQWGSLGVFTKEVITSVRMTSLRMVQGR